jgi:hypothetical protein
LSLETVSWFKGVMMFLTVIKIEKDPPLRLELSSDRPQLFAAKGFFCAAPTPQHHLSWYG